MSQQIESFMQAIPHRTLEYFASTYARINLTQCAQMTAEKLVEELKNAGMLSRAYEIYQETDQEIAKCKQSYRFYVEDIRKRQRIPTSQEHVIEAFEETPLFGKAVFLLLVQLGTMETPHAVYFAQKEAAIAS